MQTPTKRQACNRIKYTSCQQAEVLTLMEREEVGKHELGYMSAGTRRKEDRIKNTKKVISD